MFLVNVIKTITPSCLTLTFCPLSTVEPWLLLSSSVSKFNNHEKKNITCGKFIPFSFASYYPNSPLILYHYYPPANDRVGVTVPLNTPLTKHKMHPKPNCNSSSRLSGPWFGTPFSSPWCEPLQRDGLARSSLNGSCGTTGARRWEQNCHVSGEMPRASLPTPTPPPPTDFQNKELPFSHLRQTGCDGRWTGAKSYIPKLHSLSFQKKILTFGNFHLH